MFALIKNEKLAYISETLPEKIEYKTPEEYGESLEAYREQIKDMTSDETQAIIPPDNVKTERLDYDFSIEYHFGGKPKYENGEILEDNGETESRKLQIINEIMVLKNQIDVLNYIGGDATIHQERIEALKIEFSSLQQ